MKIHVPSMLAKGVETINKQTQQTSSINYVHIKSSHPNFEIIVNVNRLQQT